jgi:amino acid transporter
MQPFFVEQYGSNGTVLASSILFFGVMGFDFVSTISEEAQNGPRDVPTAMRDSVLLSTGFYILTAISMCGMGLGRAPDFNPSTAMAD